MLLGLSQVVLGSIVVVATDTVFEKYQEYGYNNSLIQSATSIGYILGPTNSNSNIQGLSGVLIAFSNDQSVEESCATQSLVSTSSVTPTYFYTYEYLYETLPIQCSKCNETCDTCIGSQ